MNALALKSLIKDGELLPALPEVAVSVLRANESAARLQAGVVRYARDDLVLTGELLSSVGLTPGEGSVADAVARLDLATLRRILYRALLPRLFANANGGHLRHEAFWQHALVTAALGEALARRIGNAWIDHVYVAALLHDIGKLVLDAAMPDQLARAQARAEVEQMFPLEAERREMGVDHTLAGKWLAEAWHLPDAYTAAIWFHHHPPGALDETDYPIGLIDLVSLADTLASERLDTLVTPGDAAQRDLRIQRLGLTREEVDELVRETEVRRLPKLAAASPPKPVPGGTARTQDLERKLQRLQILNALHLQFAPGRPSGEVLEGLAHAVRTAYAVESGCITLEMPDESVRGWLWRSLSGPIEELENTDSQYGEEAPFLHAVKTLSGSRESRGAGMVSVPILAQGQRLGHILFDPALSDLGADQEDYDGLLSFAAAGGNALLHCAAEQHLRQRTEELAASLWKEEMAHRRRLRSERLTLIGRMSAGAAHEINNPLAVIMGRAQMLLNRVHGPDEIKSLEIIADQARRVSRILNDLMQFARPARPRLQPVQVNSVLQAVVTARREQLAAKHIDIEEEYADNLPRVRLDRYQMEQVLMQLIVNAEQAMEEAGGTLRITTVAGEERRTVQIRVRDTGGGMSPEVLEHCFEPFYTTKRPGQGTGLGLSVCHGIVEAHGGSIGVVSELGRGTTIAIHLPAAADLSVVPEVSIATKGDVNAEEHHVEEAVREAAPMILLVGHDPELREVLEEILRYRGYDVLGAATGMEAFRVLGRKAPDLVLLDMDLPNQRGQHLLRELRQRTGQVPIVALASPSNADREDVKRLGARALFHKPFEMARLLSEIQVLLRFRAA